MCIHIVSGLIINLRDIGRFKVSLVDMPLLLTLDYTVLFLRGVCNNSDNIA